MPETAADERLLILEVIRGPKDGQSLEYRPRDEPEHVGSALDLWAERKGWHLRPRDDADATPVYVDEVRAIDTFRLWPGQVLRVGDTLELLVAEVDGETG